MEINEKIKKISKKGNDHSSKKRERKEVGQEKYDSRIDEVEKRKTR